MQRYSENAPVDRLLFAVKITLLRNKLNVKRFVSADELSELQCRGSLRIGSIEQSARAAIGIDEAFYNVRDVGEVSHVAALVVELHPLLIEQVPKKSPLTRIRAVDIVKPYPVAVGL